MLTLIHHIWMVNKSSFLVFFPLFVEEKRENGGKKKLGGKCEEFKFLWDGFGGKF